MFKHHRFRYLPLVGTALFLINPATSNAIDFTVNGFGSAYYGQALTKDLLPNGFTSTNPDFTDFSLIGSDLKAKLSDEWSAAAEIIAEGQSGPQVNYTVFAEWAYLNYSPIQGLSIKVGRQRYPIWSASEYINNHFELPYRVLPAPVYNLSPFAAFDGASVTETADVGDGKKASVQIFGGTPLLGLTADPTVATFNGNRLFGGRVNFEGDGWRVRAQASRATETIAWGTALAPAFGAVDSANVSTYTAGYRFDKYNIVSWGEYGYIHSNDGTILPTGAQALQSGKAGYVLVGYRIDKFMPRYTFAQTSLNDGFESGKLTTHTIGVNYEANEHVIVKAEYELDVIPSANGGPSFEETQPINPATGAPAGTGNTGSAFYLGADFYF